MNEEDGRGGNHGHGSLLPPLQTSTAAETHRHCCRFVVTGFGPFCSVPDNPTSVLVRRLRAEDRLSSTNDNIYNTAIPNTKNDRDTATILQDTHILETSADSVRTWLINLHGRLISSTSATTTRAVATKTITSETAVEDTATTTYFYDERNAGNTSTNNDTTSTVNEGINQTSSATTILLHLGVDSNSTQFKLEQCAYNDATFRVPDERGYQPHCECIALVDNNENSCSGMEASSSDSHRHPSWGKCLQTTIDLQSLCDLLRARTHENVTISTDPGRFVCNYTYYLSLDLCHSLNDENKNQQEKEEGGCANNHEMTYRALFLHVPPFEVIPEDRQIKFIQQVMEAIGGLVQSA